MSLSSDSPKRIHLVGDGRHEEALAGGAISPGHLLQLGSDSKVVVHDNAGGIGETLFAMEDALQGNSIDDNYSSGDRVSLVIANRGDVIYAWLAAGDVTAVGDHLVSQGNGTLHVPGSDDIEHVLAVALEAVTSGASAARIKVRVL